ncbi:MAG: alpha/beta fold hydrolase [Myxococcota bacterium]
MIPRDAVRYRPIIGCALSDDGRRVAVSVPRLVAAFDARVPSLYVRDLDGPERWRRLGDGDTSWFGPVFAPDGRRLATWRDTKEGFEALLFDLDRPEAVPKSLGDLPPGAGALKWRGRDDGPTCLGDDADGWRRVWALGGPDVCATPLTPAGLHVADYALRPDGERIAWLHIPRRDDPAMEHPPLHVSDGEGDDTRALPVPGRPVGYLSWSPDGRWVAYVARRAGHRLSTARLWVVDPSGWPGDPDAARCLTPDLEGWITGFDWLPDGRGVVLAVVEGTYGRLYRVDLDGRATPLGPRRTYLSAPHVDRAGGRLLFLRQDGDRPQRLRLLEPGASRSRAVSRFHRGLSRVSQRPAETVTWTAADGTRLDGVLLRPDGGGPAPLLVWLHGGPAEGIARTYSPYFQVFAHAGFAVFAPNYRGSTGRGDAFLRANVGDLGGADAEDVLSGADRLVQMGVAHPEQTALVGWSYGGTLALHAARRSAVPRVLAVGAPVVDWVSFFGAPRLPLVYREYFEGPLWEDRCPYDEASPITWIGSVDVPTLVLHGGADGMVPVSQSRLLYRSLKARGVETDLMVYPGGGHVLTRPSAVTDMLARILCWCGPRVGLPVEQAERL